MINCQNGLKSLETLQKWSRMPSFMKKSFWASQTHFWSFQNFTYGLVSESMIWYLGKSGVKYGKLSKWLEITWNFAKMIAYAFFHEKNHFSLASQTHFGSFQNFTYGLVSESMIWYLGKSGVKYGKLSKWLEITLKLCKNDCAYAFFHDKNNF